jgi:hypothetical protein
VRKIYIVAALAGAALLSAFASPKANAQTQYPSVRGVTAFTQGANFMSLPGFLRYQYLLTSGRWISREEAEEAVRQQGAG